MVKFAVTQPPARSPVTATAPTVTYEGGRAHQLDPMSELFTLLVNDMAGEPTFYESASARLTRLQTAVHAATAANPGSVAAMIPWVRNTANMRSVAVVAACEYAAYLTEHPNPAAPPARSVIASAVSRADEPAELLGYWWTYHGRRLPKAVKRGIADAVTRTFTEYSVMKYDGRSAAIAAADLLQIVHPKPRDPRQSALFKWVLDSRYSDNPTLDPESLGVTAAAVVLAETPPEKRREVMRWFGPDYLARAGMTWERLAGWLPDGMDAEAWEHVIPSMGYMATLRNLRNFEQARISTETARLVEDRLTDPDQVAKSRQLPFRFWSAFKHSGTMRFGPALETGLDLTLGNVPKFDGKTLVLVDLSGSMMTPMSARSKIEAWEAGALFAAAIQGSNVDLVGFATHAANIRTETSILRTVQNVDSLRLSRQLGHGTNTWHAVRSAYNRHDRVIIFSDMQTDATHPTKCPVPASVPVYLWDLGGYGKASIKPGTNRHVLAGLSDSSFGLINTLEAGRDAGWPWE